MIEQISLTNFKAFQSLPGLPIKPITVLCGTNSCGKSSLLQSILFLKQTFESQDPSHTVLLNGRLVHLGTFENIVYGKSKDAPVVFDLTFRFLQEDLRRPPHGNSPPLYYLLRDLIPQEHDHLENATCRLQYRVSLRHGTARASAYDLKPVIISEMSSHAEVLVEGRPPAPGASLTVRQNADATYTVSWANFHRRPAKAESKDVSQGQINVTLEFGNLSLKSIGFGGEPNRPEIPSAVMFLFYRMTGIVQNALSTFSYLGPLREEPSRRYIYEDEVVQVGTKGENAAYIYLAEQDSKIPQFHIYNEQLGRFELGRSHKLGDAVRDWLSLMGITEFRPERMNEIIYLTLDAGLAKDVTVNIADVGFGVSQIFPIILEGLRVPTGTTLVLEQPEIHLHPRLQMQLADYLVSLALSGKRVIIETHSDHIVHRLVRRIVEAPDNRMRDLVGIHFISKTPEGAVAEEVQIDPSRGIVNWPEGFFDQVATEQESIIRAGLRKRQNVPERGPQ